MPSTNGHGPKTAVLYARVSTDEQARSGYSLAQQVEALREYARSEGYRVLEEVIDPGQSGASLERPGMDRVRDLVAAGDVSVVLAQDRDRIAREPAYHYLLRKEFEDHGTKIQALNDRGDDSPEGELTDGILDQLAKYERAKFAQRSRRGMLRKAREAGICSRPPYGFRMDAPGKRLVTHEPELAVICEIFRLAAEGLDLNAIQNRLYHEGIPSPTGKPLWDIQMIKKLVENDAYKPHACEEVSALVSSEVAATLDPDKVYGVQWYNRQKTTTRTVSEPDGNGGRRYRKSRTFRWRPREEWIAIPIELEDHPPRELVDLARAMFEASKGNEKKYLSREWELRGLMRCSCGSKIGTRNTPDKGNVYHYYVCRRRSAARKAYGCTQRCIRAEPAEAEIWSFVSGLLSDPKRIRLGMEKLIEQERSAGRGDPKREAKVWANQVAECARLRTAYQDQQAAGYMTLEELGERLRELEDTRRTAEAELESLEARRQREEGLEADRDALLEYMAASVPEGLDALTGEERNKVYRMLRLEITPKPEGYEVRGAFCTSQTIDAHPRPSSRTEIV
ncbi:MAG TPA: recombinase family protein [Rubrobacteraceae bacterium]|nr:recombinase family protein [Rubrobacteraceae bacterium]